MNKLFAVSIIMLFCVGLVFVSYELGHSTSNIVYAASKPVAGGACYTVEAFSPNDGWFENAEQHVVVVPDILRESEIHMFKDKVVIDGKYARLSPAGTNSMLPAFGLNNTVLGMHTHGENLSVGTIITFDISWYDAERTVPVVHRIIDTGTDDEGFYYVVKGDNNLAIDPWRIRPEHVETVIAAVVY